MEPKRPVRRSSVKGDINRVPKDLIKANSKKMGSFGDLYFHPENPETSEEFDYGDITFELGDGTKINKDGLIVLPKRRHTIEEALYILSVEDDEEAIQAEREEFNKLLSELAPSATTPQKQVSKEDLEVEQLTVDIDMLTKKLQDVNMERQEKERLTEIRDSKRREKLRKEEERKHAKSKKKLLKAVFSMDSEPDEEEDDSTHTIDSQLGQRFGGVVSYVYDNLTELNDIEEEIRKELKTSKGMKGMFRTELLSNLLQVKDAKLRSIKELHGVGKTISDLEMKKEKAKTATDTGGKTLTDAYVADLVGRIFADEDVKSAMVRDNQKKKFKKKKKDKKKDKKGKKKKGKKYKVKKKSADRDYEKDGISVRIKPQVYDADDDDFKTAMFIGDKISKKLLGKVELTPYEQHIAIEGQYEIIVRTRIENTSDWKFEAVDKKGKVIKGFKDKYPGIIPSRKNTKLSLNFDKMKAKAIGSEKSYRIVLEN